MERVCVFCGSSLGGDPHHAEAARAVGRELAQRGIELVFGAGSVGLMGTVANAALEAGGHVIGVIPEALAVSELMHANLTETFVVPDMHARKATMAKLSDAFVGLPGGYGTFEELFEVITWSQLGFHTKPVGLCNSAGYFDPMLALLDHAVSEGFLSVEHRGIVQVASDAASLLDLLSESRPLTRSSWRDKLEA